MVKRENAHISAVMDVVPPNDWVAMVFHPDPSQSIVRDLVVFVNSLNDKMASFHAFIILDPNGCFCSEVRSRAA